MATPDITPEYLRELFSYDPHTGFLTWKKRISIRSVVGKIAGWDQNGYIGIGFNGEKYLAHRLIWLMMTGAWPTDQIDHINGIRSDNRMCNLREASNAFNHQNVRRANKNNATGLLGAFKHGNRFCSHIIYEGRHIHLGSFATAALAHSAFVEAKRKLHPGNML